MERKEGGKEGVERMEGWREGVERREGWSEEKSGKEEKMEEGSGKEERREGRSVKEEVFMCRTRICVCVGLFYEGVRVYGDDFNHINLSEATYRKK